MIVGWCLCQGVWIEMVDIVNLFIAIKMTVMMCQYVMIRIKK